MDSKMKTVEIDDEDPIRFPPDLLVGFVYIIQCKQYYKIGMSKRLNNRLSSIRVCNPFKVSLIHSRRVNNAFDLERKVHEQFKQYKKSGEWFVLNKILVEEVINYIENYGS